MLQQKGRIALRNEVEPWRRQLLREGIIEIPIDGQVGIRAVGLVGFHSDPADRLIVATALDGHRLVTGDKRILGWSGRLDRLAATE